MAHPSRLAWLAITMSLALVMSGCQAVAPHVPQAGPSTSPSPTASAPTASASLAGVVSSGASPKPRPSPSPSKAGKPKGALVFDPFSTFVCTWVPRMFVDLSGHSKPGIDVRIPVWAAQLDADITLDVRGELNGSTATATASVHATAPEWRGTVHLGLPPPDSGDYVSVATELDTAGKLSGKTPQNSRRTVAGMLPNPRPTSDQAFSCQPV